MLPGLVLVQAGGDLRELCPRGGGHLPPRGNVPKLLLLRGGGGHDLPVLHLLLLRGHHLPVLHRRGRVVGVGDHVPLPRPPVVVHDKVTVPRRLLQQPGLRDQRRGGHGGVAADMVSVLAAAIATCL